MKGWWLPLVVSIGCGVPTPRPTDACQTFETNVEEIWSQDTRARLDGRAVQLASGEGRGWVRASYRRVVTSMDQASEDWVRLSELACRELRDGTTTLEAYAARRGCYDHALLVMRAQIAQLSQANVEEARSAVTAAADLRVQVARCASDAVARHYVQSDQAAARAVEEGLARSRAARMGGAVRQSLEVLQGTIPRAMRLPGLSIRARAQLELGASQLVLGESAGARASFEEAKRISDGQPDDVVLRVDALVGLGEVALVEDRFAAALEHFEEARRLAEVLPTSDVASRTTLGTVWRHVGRAHYKQRNFEEAASAFVRAEELDRGALGDRHPSVALAMFNRAAAWVALRRGPEAWPLMQQALVALRESLGARHPEVGRMQADVAVLAAELGQHRDARQLVDGALDVVTAAWGRSHTDVAAVLINRGYVLDKVGRRGDALAAYRQALEVADTTALRPRQVGKAHWNVGRLLHLDGDHAAAEPHLAEAVRLLGSDPLAERARRVLASARARQANGSDVEGVDDGVSAR